MLYFDTLDAESVVHIVRHLSLRPRAIKWNDCINTVDALKLFCLGGVFPIALAQVSFSFCTIVPAPQYPFIDIPITEEFQRTVVDCEPALDEVCELPRYATELYTHLAVSETFLEYLCEKGISLCDLFPNVTTAELNLGEHGLHRVLHSQLASRLQCLYILRTEKLDLPDFSKCAQLRDLTLVVDVTIESTSGDKPNSFWRNVGSRLQSLRVTFNGIEDSTSAQQHLDAIRSSCREISAFHIEFRGVPFHDYPPVTDKIVETYASYGAQLIQATVVNAELGHMRELRDACRNLRLTLIHDNSICKLACLLSEANQIVDVLEVEFPVGIYWDRTLLINAMHACSRLTRFAFPIYGPDCLDLACCFFQAPLRQLIELQADVSIAGDGLDNLLYCIAITTSKIERLHLIYPENIIKCSAAFAELCTANVHLSFVRLTFSVIPIEEINNLARMLLNARCLREVRIDQRGGIPDDPQWCNYETKVQSAFMALRHRSIHVEFAGFIVY